MNDPRDSDAGRGGAVCKNVRSTRARKTAFLEAIAQIGNITAAAKAAQIHRNSHYNWIAEPNDPEGEYSKAFESAKEEYADSLRSEARRRAVEGVRRPVMYQGRQVMEPVFDAEGQPVLDENGIQKQAPLYEVEYSDRILELLLKANCPEFKDKVEVSGDGGPVAIQVVRFPVRIEDPDEWSKQFKDSLPTLTAGDDEDLDD